MTFKEKISFILNYIEENIENCNEIWEEDLSEQFGCNSRVIADSFNFLFNKSLANYMRERKLVAIVREHLNNSQLTLDNLAEKYYYSDGSALGRAIKNVFGCSISKIKNHDLDKFELLSVDRILMEDDLKMKNNTIKIEYENKNYDINDEIFEDVQKKLDIAAFYGLSNKDALRAFKLAKKYKFNYESTCEFMIDYLSYNLSGYDINQLAIICIKHKQFIKDAIDTLEQLKIRGIRKIPKGFYNVYFSKKTIPQKIQIKYAQLLPIPNPQPSLHAPYYQSEFHHPLS